MPTTSLLLTPTEASERLRVEKSTLAKWRFEGKGPPFHRIGGKLIRYDRQTIEEFIKGAFQGVDQKARQSVALPVHGPGRDLRELDRFTGHKTKSQRGRADRAATPDAGDDGRVTPKPDDPIQ